MKILKVEAHRLDYLQSFRIHYRDRFDQLKQWEMVSRGDQARLEAEVYAQQEFSDGAMMVAYNADRTQTVMIKEYRPVAGGYVYAFPAGLSDPGETIAETARREFKEETGLEFDYEGQDGPRYTSVGLSNERVHTVFGRFSGTISQEFLDGSEDIEAYIIDKAEAIRILAEEIVPIRSAFVLMKLFDLPWF